MNKTALLLASATLALAVDSSATISMFLQADRLMNENGVGASGTGSYYLIADTLRDGFSSIQDGASTALGTALSADNFIVAKGVIESGYGAGSGVLDKTLDGAAGNPPALTLSIVSGNQWDPGDPLYLVWLPAVTTSAPQFLAGMRFGSFTKSTPEPGFSDSWVTPADGTSNYTLGFFNAAGGTLSDGPQVAASGRSSQAVVPEPSTLGMAALGVIGLMSRRRRN